MKFKILAASCGAAALIGMTSPLAMAFTPSSNGNMVMVVAQDSNVTNTGSDAVGTTGNGDPDTENPVSALSNAVVESLKSNSYELANGGSVKGSSLFINTEDNVQIVNDAALQQLSRSAQNKLASDIVNTTKKEVAKATTPQADGEAPKNQYNDQTASNWFKQMQSSSGIGSKMLAQALKGGIYADMNKGAEWFRPFSGPLSSFLGFMAIAVIALMGIRSILDLSYIALPFFQVAMESSEKGGNGSGGGGGIRLVSKAAQRAVQQADNGGNPLWTYFKGAALEYIVLSLAILFLCFNYMWDIAGWVIDFGTGALGFG